MENLKARLKRHEGLSLEPYVDTEGHCTIGFGHKIQPITMHEAEAYLEQDLYKASDQFMTLKCCAHMSLPRREVCVEMVFWHGLGSTRKKTGFLGFTKCLKALEAGDWETAADELMDSDSGRKYPGRMGELAEIMRHGS